MRTKTFLAFAGSFLVAAAMFAQAPEKGKAKKVARHASATPVMWPADGLKWMDLPGAEGVKIVDLWGDHTKGAYGALIKFPAGFSVPLHTHTHEMRVVVVSGTFLHTPDGKSQVRLPAGSYLKQPGGNYRHSTECDKASECEIFAEGAGKFDLKVVGESKAAEKK